MITLIRFIFGAFWTIAAGFVFFLAFTVLRTEHDPRLLWAWLVMCGFTFISVTWLAYNIIFSHYHSRAPKHHDLHLKNGD